MSTFVAAGAPVTRPSVLVVEPEPSRRKEIANGLTALGYEVVPVLDEAQGTRFAAELAPGVVVAPARLLPASGERPPLLSQPATSSRRTILLLAETEEERQEVPEDILVLAAHGLSAIELVWRVHLVLLGGAIGVAPDEQVASLVGDLTLLPLLDLLRGLKRVGLSGRVTVLGGSGGEIVVMDGEVVAASCGRTRGMKAFCRLASREAGPFRILVSPPGSAPLPAAQREIRDDLTSLIVFALEDRVHDAPDPRTRLRVEIVANFFELRFPARQQELLAALPAQNTVGKLLDALPATDGQIVRDLLGLAELGVVVFEEPEAAVRVVTDSTCDLSPEMARAHGIQVVPLLVLFGPQVYHDGVDLKPRQFYEQLETGRVHPHSNPPLQGDFLDTYRSLGGTKDLVSIHLPEKLSRTIVHARAAAAEALPAFAGPRGSTGRPPEIEVVDSGSVSLGLGMLALFAARMAARGVGAGEIGSRIAAMRSRVHVLFVVDTLDYLARGGRIGKARAIFGNLLGIKPILGVVDGEVVAVDKVRGGRAAHPRLIQLFGERVDATKPVIVGVAHAKAPVWADRLQALIAKTFSVSELLIGEMGPVVGTHAGPGAVGAALFQPTPEEMALIAPLASAS